MTTHPNRNKKRERSGYSPSPDEVKKARADAGLTQTEAAELIYCALIAWQQWEGGTRRMHPAFFELFTRKVKEIKS